MRKIDKLNNLKRINLLIEERHFETKGIVKELSPELKDRAFKKANAEYEKYRPSQSSDYNSIKANKRNSQAYNIGHTTNMYDAEVERLGEMMGLNGEINKSSDHYNNPVITLIFKSENRDKFVGFDIFKNEVKTLAYNNVEIPDNLNRKLDRLIMKIQKTELPEMDE